MNGSVLAANMISTLLLPPLNLILICLFGLILRRRWPRVGLGLNLGALVVLAALSTTAGSLLLVAPLERHAVPLASAGGTGAQAIVVLGGGRLSNAPEYGGKDIPSSGTLVRLRYAAKLHRDTGLPLLVTGGRPDGSVESEAALMARTLRQDFAVPVKWIEGESDNTAQNAAFSASILRQAGVQKILLVTDGIHMARSQAIFERNGLQTITAPTMLVSWKRLSPLDFLPGGEGLRLTHYAMHEWIGILWYSLRYGSALRPG